MEEFFSSFLRRAGMPASAGLSCFTTEQLRTVIVHFTSISAYFHI